MEVKIIVSVLQVLGKLNELIYVKHSEQCQAHSFISIVEEFTNSSAIFLLFKYLYNIALKCNPTISSGVQLKKNIQSKDGEKNHQSY